MNRILGGHKVCGNYTVISSSDQRSRNLAVFIIWMDLGVFLQTVRNEMNACNLLNVSLAAYLTSRRKLCYHIQSLAQKCSSGLDTDIAQILPIVATFSQIMLELSERTWEMEKISESHVNLGLYLFNFKLSL